jgi:hypothetical protein
VPRPGRLAPGKVPVPIVQEAVWASEPIWIGAENLAPTGIRSPDLPAHKSLYRLRYLGSPSVKLMNLNHYMCCLLQATFDVQCGGVIANRSSGYIMSPGFPMQYDANLRCNYTILFPDRYINLEFISFDVEGLYCWTHAQISILTHWHQN